MVSFGDTFHEVAALLVLAAAAGALAVRLRQPLIVAFVAVGVVAGPSALGVVGERHAIDLFAELGIALLLFAVGLKLDVRLIRTIGPVALIAGGGQIAFTAGVGLGLALALGLDLAAAAYVALGLTFSSTVIVVKLLSDQRQLDELHGRISVGILIVQDLAVVLALIGVTAVGESGEASVAGEVALVLVEGALLLGGVALITRFALTPVLHRLAHLPELLVLSAIAWGIGLAAIGDVLGFSREVGAFLAGVSLASTPYRDAIGARLVPLRDFLLLFFFVDLGSDLDLGGLGDQLLTVGVLSAFVLVAKPIVVLALVGVRGYPKRVAFLTGVTLGQISEFSLIVAALGVSLGHIDQETLALIAAVGLVTISVSTYGIIYSEPLFERLEPWLAPLERWRGRHAVTTAHVEHDVPVDAVVCGLGRYGGRLARGLLAQGRSVLGVDYDPQAVERWRAAGHPAAYGDIEDPEFASTLPLHDAEWVISSVPRLDANTALLHGLDHHGYRGRVAVTTYHDADADELSRRGADLVLRPFATAAEQAVNALTKSATSHGSRSAAPRR